MEFAFPDASSSLSTTSSSSASLMSSLSYAQTFDELSSAFHTPFYGTTSLASDSVFDKQTDDDDDDTRFGATLASSLRLSSPILTMSDDIFDCADTGALDCANDNAFDHASDDAFDHASDDDVVVDAARRNDGECIKRLLETASDDALADALLAAARVGAERAWYVLYDFECSTFDYERALAEAARGPSLWITHLLIDDPDMTRHALVRALESALDARNSAAAVSLIDAIVHWHDARATDAALSAPENDAAPKVNATLSKLEVNAELPNLEVSAQRTKAFDDERERQIVFEAFARARRRRTLSAADCAFFEAIDALPRAFAHLRAHWERAAVIEHARALATTDEHRAVATALELLLDAETNAAERAHILDMVSKLVAAIV